MNGSVPGEGCRNAGVPGGETCERGTVSWLHVPSLWSGHSRERETHMEGEVAETHWTRWDCAQGVASSPRLLAVAAARIASVPPRGSDGSNGDWSYLQPEVSCIRRG